MTTELTPVEDLYAHTVGVQPVDYEWSSETWPESWDWIRVLACTQCEEPVSDESSEVEITREQAERTGWIDFAPDEEGGTLMTFEVERHCCANPQCSRFTEEAASDDLDDGPMMSYYCPLPDYHQGRAGYRQDDAVRIAHLPLVIVTFNGGDSYALALTGGGMDLSWQICEAFMRLGHLPPAHYADLPAMAGQPSGAVDLWIMEGCERTFEVMAARAERGAEKVRRLLLSGPRYTIGYGPQGTDLYGIRRGYGNPGDPFEIEPTLDLARAEELCIQMNRRAAQEV